METIQKAMMDTILHAAFSERSEQSGAVPPREQIQHLLPFTGNGGGATPHLPTGGCFDDDPARSHSSSVEIRSDAIELKALNSCVRERATGKKMEGELLDLWSWKEIEV